jgi:hypothetical protein
MQHMQSTKLPLGHRNSGLKLSGSVTSVVTAIATPPAWVMICAVCSPAAALISATTTLAPS